MALFEIRILDRFSIRVFVINGIDDYLSLQDEGFLVKKSASLLPAVEAVINILEVHHHIIQKYTA